MRTSLARTLKNGHAWAILAAFLILIVLHYHEKTPFLSFDFPASLGLSRHSFERILFLVPVIYTAVAFGFQRGMLALGIAALAMLPRALFLSDYPLDAMLETSGVTVVGGLTIWLLESRRRHGERLAQALIKLETMRRELESYTQIIKEKEERLSTLYGISARINQFLTLEEILDATADELMKALKVDVILLFLRDAERLRLETHRGISEWSALAFSEIGVGLDPAASLLSPEVITQEGIASEFTIPLKSKERAIGAIYIATRSPRQFSAGETELMDRIGVELGVAIEKVHFYMEAQRIGREFQEMFEKAHDAILIQDLNGKVTTINQAGTELLGYTQPQELIGKHVINFLTPDGLELARKVQHTLLSGEIMPLYEQKIIKRDGTEATLLVSTSLLGEAGKPHAFQLIARDITEERRLEENLRLYADQISRAYEEERTRIARELHDDTIQSMVVISRNVDSFGHRNPDIPKELKDFLGGIRRDVDSCLVRTRRFIQDLRPPTLEYLGLLPALRELVSDFQEQTKIDITLVIEGQRQQFAPEKELLIYRIVQEALRNVWKHSQASRAEVQAILGEELVKITVQDNGKGFDAGNSLQYLKTGKLGLAGMKERVRLLGGNLDIESRVGSGTRVTITIPTKDLSAQPAPS